MTLRVGEIETVASVRFDDHGADQYDRRTRAMRADAKRPIKTEAKLDVDKRGFDQYQRGLHDVGREHGNFVRGSGRVKGAMGSLFIGGAGIAAGGVAFAGLAKGVLSANSAFEESEKIGAQTGAVIKSTGGAAGVTAEQVGALSTAISKKTAVDDEAVQSGANMLLTFTNVRNEAGKGNDVFNQATQTLTDMSAALGTDMSQSAVGLGKALNDPIKGITALQRVGVTFTEQQKDQIKTMVEHGRTADAQKLILHELNKEFGGSAEAQATSTDRLKVTLGNLQETIGGALAPTLAKASDYVSDFTDGMMEGTGTGGAFVDTMKGLWGGLKEVVAVGGDAVDFVRDLFDGGSDRAGKLNDAVASARTYLVELWATAQDTGRGIADAFEGVQPALTTIGTFLRDVLGGALEFAYSAARRALPGIGAMLKGLATVVRGVIDVVAGILNGDFGQVWEGVKRIVSGGVRAVGGVIRAMTAPFREVMSRIGGVVSDGLSDVVGFFRRLPGRAASAIAGLAGDLAEKGADAGRRLLRGVVNQAEQLPGRLWGAIKGGVTRAGAFAGDLAEKGVDAGTRFVRGVVNRAERLPGEMLSIGKRAVSSIGRGLAGIGGAIAGALGQGGAFFGNAGRGIADWINAHTPFGDQIKVGPVKVRLPALAAGGRVGPTAGGARIFVAGEGNADEWVISQEGDRQRNTAWAVEALETLTGRKVGLHRKGKKAKKKKRPAAPDASSIGDRSIKREDRGMKNVERDLQRLTRVYGQMDRGFSMEGSDDYLVE